MKDPLIILSPPRSFSSVVSTMIGEHPEIYGFPELHLFSGRTISDIIRREEKAGNAGPPGLLRTLAQEHYGIQTANTILKATIWFRERSHWPTKKLFDYLLELVNPQVGLEKSPETAGKMTFLERSYSWFPKAYYLHLTRHPISARNSIQEFYEDKKKKKNFSFKYQVDGLTVWYTMHNNIINFTNTLPTGQTMRIKGEDLLSDPDLYLPQIADWLGLRTDAEAIEAMKHPENSPYAYVGPPPVRGGNDPKFMRNPKLRQGKVREPSLQDFWDKQQDWRWASDELKEIFTEADLDFAPETDLAAEITRLAQIMGYQ